jgi:hypothetical protein
MANEPRYRDLSKLDYIPAFDDHVVVRIGRVSMACAALAGLFGILYFSLAPAAMSTVVQVSSTPLNGHDCNMISAVSRTVSTTDVAQNDGSGIISKETLGNWSAAVEKAGESLKFGAANEASNQLEFSYLKYENVLFDTYESCLNSAKIHTTCKWTSSFAERRSLSNDVTIDLCTSIISCSSLTLSGRMLLISDRIAIGFDSRQALLADSRYGKCNSKANTTTCKNVNENCEGLSNYLSTYQELMQRFVLRPENICRPFLKNPPYLCSKTAPLNVPSILSQSFSFYSSALAGVQTVLCFAVKMLGKKKLTQADSSDAPGERKTELDDLSVRPAPSTQLNTSNVLPNPLNRSPLTHAQASPLTASGRAPISRRKSLVPAAHHDSQSDPAKSIIGGVQMESSMPRQATSATTSKSSASTARRRSSPALVGIDPAGSNFGGVRVESC